eukprot:2297980-Amphidinium_carterae.1
MLGCSYGKSRTRLKYNHSSEGARASEEVRNTRRATVFNSHQASQCNISPPFIANRGRGPPTLTALPGEATRLTAPVFGGGRSSTSLRRSEPSLPPVFGGGRFSSHLCRHFITLSGRSQLPPPPPVVLA